MQEKITQFANGKFNSKNPDVSVSVDKIAIQVSQGEDVTGSFLVTSTNGRALKGYVVSNHAMVTIPQQELSGRSQQIDYVVNSRHMLPYEEIDGEIFLIYNGGELSIPISIGVKAASMETEIGEVKDLFQFTNLMRINEEKALEVFSSSYFPDVILKGQEYERFLYHHLCKGPSLKQAMMEFLVYKGLIAKPKRNRVSEKTAETSMKEQPLEMIRTERDTEMQQAKSFSYRKKYFEKTILSTYLDYRTNQIEFAEFLDRMLDTLNRLEQYEPLSAMNQLVRLHMYVLSENHIMYVSEYPVCEEKCRLLSRTSEEVCYFRYIEALYSRETNVIEQTVAELKSILKAHPQKAACFLMLIYLDQETARDTAYQIDKIKQYFQQGLRSPLFYFEACDIFNHNADLLKELSGFEIAIVRWGMRHSYLSWEVMDRFAHLSVREKSFEPIVFQTLTQFYDCDPKLEYLTAVCSYLIKCGHVKPEQHVYLRKGVEASLKIIGIYEYYLRTLPKDSYELLPQSVLHYFLQHSGLQTSDELYLYTNIVENRLYYEQMYEEYLPKIDLFLCEQMKKGMISPQLERLYRHRFTQLIKKENAQSVILKILFKHKVVCQDPAIKGVLVHHRQEEKGVYYECKEQTAYVDLYTPDYVLLFVDDRGCRYIDSVEAEIQPVFPIQEYREEIDGWKVQDDRFLVYRFCHAVSGQHMEELKIGMAKRIVQIDWITEHFRIEVLCRLIEFYHDSANSEELDDFLKQVDLSLLDKQEMTSILELYIRRGMYQKALTAIKEYGFWMIQPSSLLELLRELLKEEDPVEGELCLAMCVHVYSKGQYDESIFRFLSRHYVSSVQTMIPIWSVMKEMRLDTMQMEETILALGMFCETRTDVYPVFESYYLKKDTSLISEAYLQYQCYEAVVEQKTLPDYFYRMVEHAYARNTAKSPYVRLALLKWYSGNVHQLDVTQLKTVKVCIHQFMEENIILPYFKAFREIMELPAEMMMKTIIAYYQKEEKNVELHYHFTSQHQVGYSFESEYMREVLPGIYTKEFMLFEDEKLFYYITVDDVTKVDVTELNRSGVMAMKQQVLPTRFDRMNELLRARKNGDYVMLEKQMLDYIDKMNLVTENITIL
ncbi:MAG: DUF5717 family protein [Lachnospiraceae bacterium]